MKQKQQLTEAQIIRRIVKDEIRKVMSEVVDISEKKSFTKYIIDHNQELSGFATKKRKDDLINYVENARALAAEGKYAISDGYLDGILDSIKTSSFKIGFMSLYNRYLAGTGNSIISL